MQTGEGQLCSDGGGFNHTSLTTVLPKLKQHEHAGACLQTSPEVQQTSDNTDQPLGLETASGTLLFKTAASLGDQIHIKEYAKK